MIVAIKGLLIKQLEQSMIIQDASGLSYEIFLASKNLDKLSENEEASLFIYHHIREDQQILFGFHSLEERQGFLTLTSVSGMGPKIASRILSSYEWAALRNDIIQSNLLNLTQLPGVGKRLAERLITELKDKLINQGSVSVNSVSSSSASLSMHQELLQALKSLGYMPNEIQQALKTIPPQNFSNDLSKNIKKALKH